MNHRFHRVLLYASLLMGFMTTLKDIQAAESVTTLKASSIKDDCSFIRSAISNLPVKGGTIHIPAGTYVCAAPIILERDNVVLKGAGA